VQFNAPFHKYKSEETVMNLIQKVKLCAFIVGLLANSVVAAQDYPNKPVRFIVPAAPGGISDSIIRLVASEMQKDLGRPVIVENVPGASGDIGTRRVVKSQPDGYTVGGITSVQTTTAAARPGKVIDITQSGIGVIGLTRSCYTLVVPASLGVKTLAEFIALAKAQQGKLAYGSVGAGSGHHVVMEMLKAAAGIDMIHAPYKGEAPATTDLIGGRIQAMFHTSPGQFAANGQVVMLGVTSPVPWKFLPDVKPISETFPSFSYYGWSGLLVPLETSPEVVARLNSAANAALKTDKVKSTLAQLLVSPAGGTPQEFAAQMQSDVNAFRKVIRDQKLVIED
jgi:tripartite-type tricarboxylate transporter receptor subunit TctC